MAAEGATILGLTRTDRAVLRWGSPIAGLVLGLVLFRVAEWASEHVPVFRAVTKLLTASDSNWDTVAFAVLGVILGFAFAVVAILESLVMTLTDSELQLRKKRVITTFSRGDVSAVFVDGKQLVLVGQRSEELFRDAHDSKGSVVAAAFRDHGWPWVDSDPHAKDFRRWVPDVPDLPPAVNALLAARGRALTRATPPRQLISALRSPASAT